MMALGFASVNRWMGTHLSSRRRNRRLFDTLKGLFLFATLAVGYLLSGHPVGVAYVAVMAGLQVLEPPMSTD